MKTYKKINANSYNDFCWKISRMFVNPLTIISAGTRYKMFDAEGNIVASYDERKNHGLVVNYNS